MFYRATCKILLVMKSTILSPISKFTFPIFLLIREFTKDTYIRKIVQSNLVNMQAWLSAVKEFLISANDSMFKALISTPIVLREYIFVLFLSQFIFLVIHGDLLDFSDFAQTVSPLSSIPEDPELVIKINSSGQDVVDCGDCQNSNVYAGLTGSSESDYFISLFIVISAVTIIYG